MKKRNHAPVGWNKGTRDSTRKPMDIPEHRRSYWVYNWEMRDVNRVEDYMLWEWTCFGEVVRE